MIGWKPRPFIFVHIPRCAGTSIELALLPAATGAARLEDLPAADRARHWLPSHHGRQHAKLVQIIGSLKPGDFFKFAIVRNPWARAVSQIEYLRAKEKKPPFTSDDFRDNLRAYCMARFTSHGHDLGAGQLDYLVDASGKMAMDVVGRYETLAADFKKICAGLGLAKPVELPHVHHSARARPYQDYYDQKTADWIRRRFAKDIEYFGYEFD